MEATKKYLTIDEKLGLDIDRIVVKYMKLVPNANFSDEDIFDMSINILSYFNESLAKAIIEKETEERIRNKPF